MPSPGRGWIASAQVTTADRPAAGRSRAGRASDGGACNLTHERLSRLYHALADKLLSLANELEAEPNLGVSRRLRRDQERILVICFGLTAIGTTSGILAYIREHSDKIAAAVHGQDWLN